MRLGLLPVLGNAFLFSAVVHNVRIANCFIDSWDDSICPKTSLALGEPRPTENVTVTNCILTSSRNELKLGTESSGDFKNIAFSNCAFFPRRDPAKRDVAGIAIEQLPLTLRALAAEFEFSNRTSGGCHAKEIQRVQARPGWDYAAAVAGCARVAGTVRKPVCALAQADRK